MFTTIVPSEGDWSDTDALFNDPPKIVTRFLSNAEDTKYFDIHPGSAYAIGDSVEDVVQGGANDIVVPDSYKQTDCATASSATGVCNLCSERWYLSLTAIACVEMTGRLTRLRNTGDTAHDIILDYSFAY